VGRLIYLMNVSLDGYTETADHSLDWTIIDDEIHQWFADDLATVDASLYGRRLYETMSAYWPTSEDDPAANEVSRNFGRVWRATPRFVVSSTLDHVDWNSRLVQGDPAEVLAQIREEYTGDIEVGGPTLAAAFVERGLVDAYRLVIHPVVLGGGTPFFPPLKTRIRLRRTETRRFASGAVYVGYETVRDAAG
jgi:dihydrofolate reductase